MAQLGDVLWEPDQHPEAGVESRRFVEWLRTRGLVDASTFDELLAWSIADLEVFWTAVAEFYGVKFHSPWTAVMQGDTMPDVRWFPGATVNYAEHALQHTGPQPAVVSVSQTRDRVVTSRDELRDAVARCRAGLVRLGVGFGDRVVGYLPNAVEAVVAHFAVASLGAIWSSCSPEIGVKGVVDRFGQIEPKVLIAADGYRFGTKLIDRRDAIEQIVAGLPTVEHVVYMPYATDHLPADSWITWADLLSRPADLEFTPVPFEHPLVVLYSSGTTGPPKAIVHGHGGVLLEHLKWAGLQFDVRDGDRFFWYSTTSWIMWNLVVSVLLLGATAIAFDGDLNHPDITCLWRLAEDEDVTCFGVGAGLLVASRKFGVPLSELELPSLRVIGSTGSPLPLDCYTWIYDHLPNVMLSSASGGTDVASAFVGGSPLLPVYAGELSGNCLGVDAIAADDDGNPVIDQRGELVIRKPMPSMPVGFWGDTDGSKLRDAYFNHFPGVWRHGDWVVHTSRGSWIIGGRSDATLNRGGVRLGTGEYYALLERDHRIADSLIVFLDDPDGGNGRLILFVDLVDQAAEISEAFERELRDTIRRELSPRHVPDDVRRIRGVPRTHSGKKLEVPVKRVLLGEPLDKVVSKDAVANPETLVQFQGMR